MLPAGRRSAIPLKRLDKTVKELQAACRGRVHLLDLVRHSRPRRVGHVPPTGGRRPLPGRGRGHGTGAGPVPLWHADGRLGGDFNVAPADEDVWDPNVCHGGTHVSAAERLAFARLCAWGLVDAYRVRHREPGRYTWWDYRAGQFHKNFGMRIDHLLVTAGSVGAQRRGTLDALRVVGRTPAPESPGGQEVGWMKVASILAAKAGTVVTIGRDQTVREALGLFASHNIGALVVVDRAQKVVGMITERGILRSALTNERTLFEPVGAVMTREVVIGQPEDDLMSVAHTMTEKRIRHLPIMNRGMLIGIVSLGDLVKAQRDQYEGQVVTLEAQLPS